VKTKNIYTSKKTADSIHRYFTREISSVTRQSIARLNNHRHTKKRLQASSVFFPKYVSLAEGLADVTSSGHSYGSEKPQTPTKQMRPHYYYCIARYPEDKVTRWMRNFVYVAYADFFAAPCSHNGDES